MVTTGKGCLPLLNCMRFFNFGKAPKTAKKKKDLQDDLMDTEMVE